MRDHHAFADESLARGPAPLALVSFGGSHSYRAQMVDLVELLEQVQDEKSFLAFARALAADFERSAAQERERPSPPHAPAAESSENVRVDSFLAAAVAWAEDSGMGQRQGLPGGPSWRAFAEFLYCGKIYE